MSDGATASSGDLAFALLPILTDGRTHAVIVVDADRQILGLITQTDLLTALARSLPANEISPAVASA
jgi:CBS domain-containing membrane protein